MPLNVKHRIRGSVRRVSSRLLPAGTSSIRTTLDLLRPVPVRVPLVRIGGDRDGGYLLPDDFEGISGAFSPGVSDTWDFERELGERYGMRSWMADGSVDAPTGLNDLQHFDKLWLGATTRGNEIALGDWVASHSPEGDGDLLLQMDIEGAEWKVLAATPVHFLRRFRILVIEFHRLHRVSIAPILRWQIRPVLGRLNQDFQVVHVHPNNCCPVHEIGGTPVPEVLEVTYLRRDRGLQDPLASISLPHPLDRDCVPSLPPVQLPSHWPW